MHLGRERGDMKALDYFPSQETEREECKREEKAEGGLHSNCSELEVVVFTGELQNPPTCLCNGSLDAPLSAQVFAVAPWCKGRAETSSSSLLLGQEEISGCLPPRALCSPLFARDLRGLMLRNEEGS